MREKTTPSSASWLQRIKKHRCIAPSPAPPLIAGQKPTHLWSMCSGPSILGKMLLFIGRRRRRRTWRRRRIRRGGGKGEQGAEEEGVSALMLARCVPGTILTASQSNTTWVFQIWIYQQQQWKSGTLRGSWLLAAPRWVLHEEGWHPKGYLACLAPCKCFVWTMGSMTTFATLIFWNPNTSPPVPSVPIKGPGKAFFPPEWVSRDQMEPHGKFWAQEKAFLLHLHWKLRLRGRTLAGKQVAFGPHWVGLTFQSEQFTLK